MKPVLCGYDGQCRLLFQSDIYNLFTTSLRYLKYLAKQEVHSARGVGNEISGRYLPLDSAHADF